MKLHLFPTPIGPFSEMQQQSAYQLAIGKIQHFLVENERTARRFLGNLQMETPIRELNFFVLDKHTTYAALSGYLAKVPPGHNVGVLSEAGCPGVADPGALAVQYAHEHQVEVLPYVGPSSFVLALMASGLNGQSFAFHGYLPIQRADRAAAILKLEKDSRQGQMTQIFMETPYRNNQLVEELLKVCASHTKLCIAANLQADGQFIGTRSIGEWKAGQRPDLHKKPAVFLMLAQ